MLRKPSVPRATHMNQSLNASGFRPHWKPSLKKFSLIFFCFNGREIFNYISYFYPRIYHTPRDNTYRVGKDKRRLRNCTWLSCQAPL